MYSTSIVQYIYNKRKGGEDKESKMKRETSKHNSNSAKNEETGTHSISLFNNIFLFIKAKKMKKQKEHHCSRELKLVN
jgi:hypothetical protein